MSDQGLCTGMCRQLSQNMAKYHVGGNFMIKRGRKKGGKCIFSPQLTKNFQIAKIRRAPYNTYITKEGGGNRKSMHLKFNILYTPARMNLNKEKIRK